MRTRIQVMMLLSLIAWLMPQTATAQDETIVFTPQWTAQAQFAGYYVAEAKGFYRQAGVNVKIEHRFDNTSVSTTTLVYHGAPHSKHSFGLPVFFFPLLTMESIPYTEQLYRSGCKKVRRYYYIAWHIWNSILQ